MIEDRDFIQRQIYQALRRLDGPLGDAFSSQPVNNTLLRELCNTWLEQKGPVWKTARWHDLPRKGVFLYSFWKSGEIAVMEYDPEMDTFNNKGNILLYDIGDIHQHDQYCEIRMPQEVSDETQ